jgi:hypothetical protein
MTNLPSDWEPVVTFERPTKAFATFISNQNEIGICLLGNFSFAI